jgi:ABC-type uncharacterized transport system ATPase subunit
MTEKLNPVVTMRSVSKRFLEVTANNKINFELFPGEICALLGENGAGKTTLMNILFGYYTCDEGEIFIKGKKVELISPRDAICRGIGMIHQHFTLAPSQSVLENIIIGTKSSKGLFLDIKAATERLMRLQERFGLQVDHQARVWTLSVGEQQKVEILKALYRDVDILIMDEPTAVLAPVEIRDLFKTLKSLVKENKSVIFISHKLNEVMEISDRILVLRGGEVIAEKNKEETSARELVNLMVGREMLERLEKKQLSAGEAVLEIEELTVADDKGLEAVKGIDLLVRKQEIVGLAGVSGNGQSELCQALFGLREPLAGTIMIEGKQLPAGDPRSAVRGGMARIPEDRIETGLMMDLTVAENMVLENHISSRFSHRGLINFQAIDDYCDELIKSYSIKTAGRDAAAKSLSGGNLQKAILARELSGSPVLIIASQPTRGLDVGAMEYIHQRLLEEKEHGAGVLVVSDDLDEIFALSDRIIVMYEGRIMADIAIQDASREQVGLWMSGVSK